MTESLLEVNFADSSDEDNHHTARMELVADSAEPVHEHEPLAEDDERHGEASRGSLWSRFYQGAARSLTAALGDPRRTEPFPGTDDGANGSQALVVVGNDENGSFDSRENDNWGYGVFGSSTESTRGSSTADGDSMANLADYYDENHSARNNDGDVAIDLRNTILQYQQTPAEFYMNLILATLKSGSVVIDGEVLSAAAGSPLLMKTCLDSGLVDVEDPLVQRLVQDELDRVLVGDPYEGHYVAAEQADYLTSLVSVKSARITNPQLVLMRYSGFEFIKMLHSNPHLYTESQNRQRISFVLFRALSVFNMVTAWIGIVAELTLSAGTIWSAVFWFHGDSHKVNNGYWTIICYVFGFVISIVTTSISEQSKIVHYDQEKYRFPDNRLKFVPLIPLYELVLIFTNFRYGRMSSKAMYFVIRYDLRNAIALQQIFANICSAIPQIIIQAFLQYDRVQQIGGHFSEPCFWLLVGGGGACFLVATFAMIRVVMFGHSCNSLGFAFMHVVPTNISHFRRLLPSDMVTRFLMYTVFCFCVSTIVTLICPLFNLENCDGPAKTYLSIFVGVAGVNVVLTVLITLFVPFSRLLGLLAFPCVIMQIAYFPFAFPKAAKHEALPFDEACTFFRYSRAAYLAADYTVFGFAAAALIPWIIICLIELISGKRIRQEQVDSFIE